MTKAETDEIAARVASLRRLIEPTSVAVVGASNRTGHFAHQPLVNLRRHGFRGEVYPVNPRYDEVAGYRCYPDLGDLPNVPDLVVAAVRPELAVQTVDRCGELGVGAVVVVGSGFAETNSADGRRLQQALLESVARGGVRLCGPNTLGVANFHTGAVSYASGNLPDQPRVGPVAVVSQSGGCSFTLLNRAWRIGIGIGHVAVAGNELDISIAEFLEYYLMQPEVKSVACYLEAVRDAEGLRRVGALSARLGKPVFVMKSGSSEPGIRAAAAHTGALATSDVMCSAAFGQWGLIRARSFDELISAAGLAAHFGEVEEQHFGVYAQGGGLAVVASDLFADAGLSLAEIGAATVAKLKARMPDTTPANPFDSGGQFLSSGAGVLTQALTEFADDPAVTSVVYMLMPVAGARLAVYTEGIVNAARDSPKPSVVMQYGAGAISQESTDRIVGAGILLLDPPEAGICALRLWSGSASRASGLSRRPSRRSDPGAAAQTRELVRVWRAAGRHRMAEHELGSLLAAYGIGHARQFVVTDESQLAAATAALSPPYAVKIVSDRIAHKSDVGGVVLGLASEQEVAQARRDVIANVRKARADAAAQVVAICEMAPAGLELIVGATRDPTFGPAVLLGVGGIYAEILQDTAVCLAPLGEPDVLALIGRLRGSALLRGARGRPGVDLAALADVVIRVGELAVDLGEDLQALDLNPVIAGPAGAGVIAADALLELSDKG
jgi:acetate---CoA ligase (ADP-forming)